jgi:hypothetical protein
MEKVAQPPPPAVDRSVPETVEETERDDDPRQRRSSRDGPLEAEMDRRGQVFLQRDVDRHSEGIISGRAARSALLVPGVEAPGVEVPVPALPRGTDIFVDTERLVGDAAVSRA